MSDLVKPRYYAKPVDVEDSPDDICNFQRQIKKLQFLETNQKLAIFE